MPTRFTKLVPPREPKGVLILSVINKLNSMDLSTPNVNKNNAALHYILNYFASIELKMILEDLREKESQ